MSTDHDDNPKPVWVVYVRPIGAPKQPWLEHRVTARSANQADAILRRMGYEMQTGTAFVSQEHWPMLMPNEPLPVTCTQCGYLLDGLTVNGARISCPECNFGQILVPWSPEFIVESNTRYEIVKNWLAAFGLIALILVVLIFVMIF